MRLVQAKVVAVILWFPQGKPPAQSARASWIYLLG